MAKRSDTSSRPRPAPAPERIPARPPIQHQTQRHDQPKHTRNDIVSPSGGGKK